MECPNCGQFLDISSGENYIKCEYCRSVVAVMTYAEELISALDFPEITEDRKVQIKNMLKMANIDLESKNYKTAYSSYDKILSSEPFIWEAIVNQAICVFWMGKEDMQHMREVNALLQKADKLSNKNPLVNRSRKDIAHNLAVIASKKERYGDNISWSIETFKISRLLIDEDEKRDEVIKEYASVCYKDIFDRLQRGLQRDKKKFDPPLSDIKTLCELSVLTNGKVEEVIESAVAFTTFKSFKYHNNQDIKYNLEKVKTLYKNMYPSSSLPQISIPVFGSPKIT